MNRIENAVELMRRGNNCGMAVLTSFGEKYGLGEELSLKLGRPLGAGMGLLGQTCGAVSAGFLALGLTAGPGSGEGRHRQEIYRLVRKAAHRFEEKNGSVVCRELLGLDLAVEQELAEFRERNMIESHCLKYVRDMAEILEDMM